MGCDIHIYTEVFRNGEWEIYEGKNLWIEKWKRELQIAKEENNKDDIEMYKEWIALESKVSSEYCTYQGWNYNLFGILANVRNGRGFAGVDTGDAFIPIDMPRGLPNNVSQEVREEADKWGIDGHNHSYFTLKELKDYLFWDKTNIERGVVGVEGYKEFLKNGRPKSWCGDVGGGSVVMVDNETMEKIIAGEAEIEDDKSYYTKIEWEVTYKEAAGSFYIETIPRLEEIAEDIGLEQDEIRIVFWFDN